MKKMTNILYWATMIGLLLWFSYSKGWIFGNFDSITAKEAIVLLAHDENVTLIDVRTIQEYKEGHLQDATLIPVQSLSQNLGMIKQNKNKKVLVYCRTGNRSVSASRILKAYGFTPVNIKGGIIALASEGAMIVK